MHVYCIYTLNIKKQYLSRVLCILILFKPVSTKSHQYVTNANQIRKSQNLNSHKNDWFYMEKSENY